MTKRRMRFGFACATESPHFGQFMNRYCARLVLRVLLVLVGISLAGCVRLAPVVEAGGVQTGWGERWDRRIGLEAMAIDTREKAASGEPIPDYALTGLSLCGVCLETQTARVDGVCMRLISVPTSVVRGFDVSVLGGNRAVFGLQCTALAGFSGPTTGVSVAGLVNAGVGGYGWRGALLANFLVDFSECGLVGAETALVANTCSGTLVGGQLACLNFAQEVQGAQVGAYNSVARLNGVQFGLFNVAKEGSGVQVGLLNFEGLGAFHWPLIRIL